MDTFLVIGYTIFCMIVLAGFPPFIQWRLLEENIDVKYFKKIKVTKLSFLFRGIGGKECIGGDVKKDGVIIPMFIFQILGYCLSIVSTTVILILYFTEQISDIFALIFQFSLIGVEIVLLITLTIICVILTKKRRKQEENNKQQNYK